MIRYAVMTPGLVQPGGAERLILIKARYADPSRMSCTGVALSGWGQLDESLATELSRYTTIHGDMPRGKQARPRSPLVKTTYRDLNEAVLHVCREADVLLTWGSLSVARYTEGLDIPVVFESHCGDPTKEDLGGVTHLVAVSEAARRFFAAVPGADALPTAVIPNGVEVDRACPRRGRAWQREQWGVSAADKVMLYLGRQASTKNPWASIQTLARLPPEYKLIMVGNQSYHHDQPIPRLVELVDVLGLRDRVQFLPPVAFVGDALAGADCLMHLSLCGEADSMTIKESFLAGLPIVHTPVGAIPEMEAEFGQLGWGVTMRPGEPGPMSVDPEEAAEAVRKATAKSYIGDVIVARMRALAWERWTGQSMCARWADYLEGVVAGWTRR